MPDTIVIEASLQAVQRVAEVHVEHGPGHRMQVPLLL